jgi:hypothetical protein
MSGRRVHIRKCKEGSSRLRFYHVHDDQIETILLALEIAREVGESDFDAVALDRICLWYIVSVSQSAGK